MIDLRRRRRSAEFRVSGAPDAELNNLSAVHALMQLLGGPASSFPLRPAPVFHEDGGLAGRRLHQVMASLHLQHRREPLEGLRRLAEVVASLVAEISQSEQFRRDKRELSHLRLLHALALGLFARRWADAYQGARDPAMIELAFRLPRLRSTPWWQRTSASQAETWDEAVMHVAGIAAESAHRAVGEPYVVVLQADTLCRRGMRDPQSAGGLAGAGATDPDGRAGSAGQLFRPELDAARPVTGRAA